MKTKEKINAYWHFSIIAMLVLIVTCMPEFADAATLNKALCKMDEIVQGTTGKAIAIAAIIILGLMALMGKISWGLGILVVLGIGLMFGAGQIVNVIESGDVCTGVSGVTVN